MSRFRALCIPAVAGLLCSYFLVAAAAPSDRLPISIQGAGPYYQITLPAATYALAKNGDLSDLRVLNAAGQAVPFAWVRSDTPQHQAATRTVPLFPLPTSSSSSPTDVALSFVIRTDGSLELVRRSATFKDAAADWLMDTSQVRGRLLQAHFGIPSGVHGLMGFRLDASNDLKNWRTLGGEEQLVRLVHEKQDVERLSVDLNGIQSRFLRLRWSDPVHSTHLVKVTIDSVEDLEPQPVMEWSGYLSPDKCGEDFCDYSVPAGAPVASLKVQLGQSNTLSQVRLYGLFDKVPEQRKQKEVFRNPLYALRHQQRKTATDGPAREVLLTDGVIYRLNDPDGEIISPAIQLSGGVYQYLRLRTAGPIRNLGVPPPKLSMAVPLRTLVFLGQGVGPYSVARVEDSGAAKADAGGPVALNTLIPGYKPEVLNGLELGRIVVAANDVTLKQPIENTVNQPENAATNRRFWLWGALVVGLLLLAGMAWSLLGSLKKGEPAARAQDA